MTRTVVLAGTLLLGLGWITVQLREGTRVQSLLATPSSGAKWIKTDLTVPGSGAELAGLRDRPLMYASRSPNTAPPPEPIDTPPTAPSYRLAGTIIAPRKPARALLVPLSAAGPALRVKPGDELEGWTVRLVEVNRVVLRAGDQEVEIARSDAARGSIRLVRAAVGERGASASAGAAASGEGRLLSASRSGSGSASGNLPRGKAALLNQPRLYRPPPQ